MPEAQHTFPVFHPRANKVISFVGSAAEQEGPTASRLEAGSHPPPGSKQREEVAWAPLGEGLPQLFSPHVLLGGTRTISTLMVSKALSPGRSPLWITRPIYLLPISLRSLPGCLASISDPTCPTRVFSGIAWVFFMFPTSGAITIHPAAITVHPAQSLLARQPDILVRASQPWPRLQSRQCGKGSCLAQLSPTHCEFSRGRLD